MSEAGPSVAPATVAASTNPPSHANHHDKSSSKQRGGRSHRGRGRGRGGASRIQTQDAAHAPSNTGETTTPATTDHPRTDTSHKSEQQQPSRNAKRSSKKRDQKANSTNPLVEATASGSTAPPAPNARRKQFGGKLTGAGGKDAASTEPSDAEGTQVKTTEKRQKAKAIPRTVPAGEPVEYADLRSRLLAELASGQYDCVVCYSTVTTRQATWSCTQCYTVLHLGCVRKWAESSVKKAEEYNAMQEDPEIRNRRGTWRCPGCQYAREDVPKTYWCWCGRIMDPPGGRGANPHGCGQRCGRGKCQHGCADTCHPGPCPPCAVTVSQQCFCGAQTIPMRCSQSAPISKDPRLASLTPQSQRGTSCGQLCNRKLDCGVHTCSEICHPGECQPCTVQLDARCYCGKHTRTLRCGDGVSKPSYDDDTATAFEGRFACDDACERPFDCGHHACSRPCHPRDAQRSTCPASPELVKTCPCGAQRITDRTSCQDPITTCNSVCSKPFACGHTCPAECHLGACPPCQVAVSTPCRCGETKQTRPCHERQREESEGNQEVLCNTTCKAQRHCGRHQCNRQCCPLFFQAKSKAKKRPTMAELQAMDPVGFHECSVPCSKPLACGLHDCPMACHRGSCPPCLQASFEELACHCGRTVLEPPVPCGTKVRCNFPCVRPPPPCGHPKLPHDCHEEERCPPCVYLTDKVCHCQKHIVKNVPCSRSRVSCGQPCEALLNCGFHRCQGICHVAPDECAPCSQTCGKPRKLCHHPCMEKCHAPSSCPETEACEAVVTLQCPCGNLQTRAKCGVSIHSPNKDKSLKCNDSCIIAQRNAKLAEALGLNPSEKTAPSSYDYETLAYYAIPANRRFCDELEATLNDFIRSPRAGMILPPTNKLQRKFTHELAAVYRLASESVDYEPRRSVSIRRKQDSRIPTPLLSEAFASAKVSMQEHSSSTASKPAGLAQLRRPGTESPKPLNAVFLPGVFGHDQDSLRAVLQPVLRTIGFSVTWKGDEDVVITSSDSPTRLIMMKTELKALVRREQLARDVILCTVDAAKNVIRREDEPVLGAAARSTQPQHSAPSAWGASLSMKRTGSNATGSTTPSGGTASRGWAAIASGSGRTSPATQQQHQSDLIWGQPAPRPTNESEGTAPAGSRANAPIAGIVPNPNAPKRYLHTQPNSTPMASATDAKKNEQDARSQHEGPVPESWEDEDDNDVAASLTAPDDDRAAN
ncbi:hypothetical protein BCV70DRAFT_197851 [Testicularia cyperi]|uniref:R3H domain-containing protein n=1 Tax=Testicularia cyperi TaxID=1882483 RepID=A0A317XZW4_9BASI|nr:hypothetical protein BCV70DRAFT_197851 [Testicularia cyperi]